jgi:VWFA-related protein
MIASGMRWIVAAAVTIASILYAQVPTPTVIRVPVRVVTVPTLIFSKDGQLIPGLDATNFKLFDNGRPQKLQIYTAVAPVSLAVVVQANQDVREYVPFIARTGSLVDALVAGEEGESAVVAYNDDITVLKPFDSGDLQHDLGRLAVSGKQARLIDAGVRAVDLLKQRPGARARVLLFIGQPGDKGSEAGLATLREHIERDNIAVHALTLPLFGKAFVYDTVTLEILSSRTDRGGFKAGVDLLKLSDVLSRRTQVEQAIDPFSVLTGASGGAQLFFRKQKELEGALATIGVALRSAYILSYSPDLPSPGHHSIRVDVTVPGARVFARSGYSVDMN